MRLRWRKEELMSHGFWSKLFQTRLSCSGVTQSLYHHLLYPNPIYWAISRCSDYPFGYLLIPPTSLALDPPLKNFCHCLCSNQQGQDLPGRLRSRKITIQIIFRLHHSEIGSVQSVCLLRSSSTTARLWSGWLTPWSSQILVPGITCHQHEPIFIQENTQTKSKFKNPSISTCVIVFIFF